MICLPILLHYPSFNLFLATNYVLTMRTTGFEPVHLSFEATTLTSCPCLICFSISQTNKQTFYLCMKLLFVYDTTTATATY